MMKQQNYGLTPEQIEAICTRYQAGESSPALATAYGIPKSTALRMLRAARIHIRTAAEAAPNRACRERALTAEERAVICQRYQAGESSGALAKDFAASIDCICKIISKAGIEKRPQGKLTPAQRAEVCHLYALGKTPEAIGQRYGLSKLGIYQFLKSSGMKMRGTDETNRRYTLNETFFDQIESNEEAAYWAGFIGADGNITRNTVAITLSSKDEMHLRRFAQALDSDYPVRTSLRNHGTGKGNYYSEIKATSGELVAGLLKVGIGAKKTFSLKWPSLPDEALRHFLRGYVDGDGCWSLTRTWRPTPGLMFSVVGNLDFLAACQEFLMRECGLRKTVIGKTCGDAAIGVLVYGGAVQVGRIADFLYRDSSIYLARKLEIARPFLSPSTSIQPLKPVQLQLFRFRPSPST